MTTRRFFADRASLLSVDLGIEEKYKPIIEKWDYTDYSATPKPRSTKKPKSTKNPASDYYHPEDFYEDYYDDFWDYEDAEYYWEEYG